MRNCCAHSLSFDVTKLHFQFDVCYLQSAAESSFLPAAWSLTLFLRRAFKLTGRGRASAHARVKLQMQQFGLFQKHAITYVSLDRKAQQLEYPFDICRPMCFCTNQLVDFSTRYSTTSEYVFDEWSRSR